MTPKRPLRPLGGVPPLPSAAMRTRVTAAAFAAGLVLSACGGSSTSSSSATTVETSAVAESSQTSTAAPPTTQPAPAVDVFDTAQILDGSVATIAGDDFDLAALRGSDLVVWFWAPW